MNCESESAWIQIYAMARPASKARGLWFSVLLDNLAAGEPVERILKNYPTLTREDIQAALQHAAELARERIVPLPAAS